MFLHYDAEKNVGKKKRGGGSNCISLSNVISDVTSLFMCSSSTVSPLVNLMFFVLL